MKVVIAGGHGKVALLLEQLLSERGDVVTGLIRNPAQAEALEKAGAQARLVDLEKATSDEVARHLTGADAVVFAAGAGPGSSVGRKDSVDRGAAILLADAAESAGAGRYLLLSAMSTDLRAVDDESLDPVFRTYLRAKLAAESAVRSRTALQATIVRPGLLDDTPGTGRVTLAERTGPGPISRADVAAVLLALLDESRLTGRTVEVIGGSTPIADAVAAHAAH
ncbi:SDR family oxidoreductase [Streptomyces stelliscabiei]|uniref:SDR family oxidoreductase n=1 Tax=Streptomyces stelliscabiei TaxID=146820 RepID=UPI0029B61A43|nr:SDR family oxidoreductase [Streptomyces stelliscabiei]MDX2550512.1 SDR family oxidoreductase [Streptomyces stelliscabiei]MDX2610210.1 SDR family oxidoreductase [Streptomyces stelliscabiei]MDX2634869.1 SDR family oxidoreductase [Streptomyces stelliscabiei]MDX2659815.1 SDR family oxidoreductase [Streptomyces stelliscabiei]MDX2711492.1 SDR family oxidoreductase [Streptomyces stelliscabiei]